jgi:hypothetical protein
VDSRTYADIQRDLGPELMRQMQASIDDAVPTGTVEQRTPGQPAVRMSAASFVARTRVEVQRDLALLRARRKQERQNRKRGRR